jgi:hypothetical protein
MKTASVGREVIPCVLQIKVYVFVRGHVVNLVRAQWLRRGVRLGWFN